MTPRHVRRSRHPGLLAVAGVGGSRSPRAAHRRRAHAAAAPRTPWPLLSPGPQAQPVVISPFLAVAPPSVESQCKAGRCGSARALPAQPAAPGRPRATQGAGPLAHVPLPRRAHTQTGRASAPLTWSTVSYPSSTLAKWCARARARGAAARPRPTAGPARLRRRPARQRERRPPRPRPGPAEPRRAPRDALNPPRRPPCTATRATRSCPRGARPRSWRCTRACSC